MSALKPILEISTSAQARHVLIDGARYHLVAPNAVSISEFRRMSQIRHELSRLQVSESPDLEREAELGLLVKRMAKLVLHAPEKVHAKLSDLACLAIIVAFSEGVSQPRPARKGPRRH